MHSRGERWELHGGEQAIIIKDLADGFVSVINDSGKMEAIHENLLRHWLNKTDFIDDKKEPTNADPKS